MKSTGEKKEVIHFTFIILEKKNAVKKLIRLINFVSSADG